MSFLLSDRKRRTYLCSTLPQNLSPKKLSVKDRRFLQKNIRNYLDSYSFLLIKQQKLLYLKHCGKNSLENFLDNKKSFGEKSKKTLLHLFFQVWQKSQKYKTVCLENSKSTFFPSSSLVENCQRSLKTPPLKTKDLTLQFINKFLKRENSFKANFHFLNREKIEFNNPNYRDFKNNLKVSFKTKEKSLNFKNQKKGDSFQKSCSLYPSLSIYVQTIKTLSKNRQPSIFQKIAFEKLSLETRNSLSTKSYRKKEEYPGFKQQKEISNQKFARYSEKTEIIKNCLLEPSSATVICKAYAFAPQFVNGGSKYLYCRYLYSKEQLKTCINPQVIPDTLKKHAKLLHERKKISLFYGSLAKKDISIHCKKAKSLPGFFEDNFYTILESRYDVLIFRAGFASTIAAARHLIRRGFFYVNGKSLCSTKVLGKPGDVLTVKSPCFLENAFHYNFQLKSLYNLYLSKDPEKTIWVKKKSFLYSAMAFYNYNSFSCNSVSNNSSRMSTSFLKRFLIYKTTTLKKPNYIAGISKKHLEFYKKILKIESGEVSSLSCLYPAFSLYQKLSIFVRDLSKTIFNDLRDKGLNPNQQDNFGGFKPKKSKHLEKRETSKSLIFSERKSKIWYKNLNYVSRQCELLRLNIYCAAVLKNNFIIRQKFYVKANKEKVFFKFMKNIQNANCASIWGQKPLHLELSNKTLSFIYLYRPQKIVSPMFLDFYALKKL